MGERRISKFSSYRFCVIMSRNQSFGLLCFPQKNMKSRGEKICSDSVKSQEIGKSANASRTKPRRFLKHICRCARSRYFGRVARFLLSDVGISVFITPDVSDSDSLYKLSAHRKFNYRRTLHQELQALIVMGLLFCF